MTANVTFSMINYIEINKQHHCFSESYGCKIVLTDGREKSVNLAGGTLYSFISVLGQNLIHTHMDYAELRNTLNQEHIYGTFTEDGEAAMTKIFNRTTNSPCWFF